MDNPRVKISGGTTWVTWNEGIGVKMERGRSNHLGDPQAEVTVQLIEAHGIEQPGVVFGPDRLVLTSRSGKDGFIRTLNKRMEDPPVEWFRVIEVAARKAVEQMRLSAPVVMIGHEKQHQSANQGFALYPVLRRGVPTVMYGEGGSGKTLIAIYFSLLIQGGFSANGVTGEPGAVLYLDWETDASDFEQRVFAIAAGDNRLEGVEVAYRHCGQPLLSEMEAIAKIVAEHGIDTVVIDSFEAALGGGGNDIETIMQAFNALRELNLTVLLIDHKSKGDAAQTRSVGPINSVMKTNRARSVWEVAEKNGVVAMYHKKSNTGKKQKPLAFKIGFTGDHELEVVEFERTEVSDEPDLDVKRDLIDQIETFLIHAEDGQATIDEIAEGLGAKPQSVRNTCGRYKDKRLVQLGNGKWARLISVHNSVS